MDRQVAVAHSAWMNGTVEWYYNEEVIHMAKTILSGAGPKASGWAWCFTNSGGQPAEDGNVIGDETRASGA